MKTRHQSKDRTRTLDLVFDVETTGLLPSKMSNIEGTKNREVRELSRKKHDETKYPITYKNVADSLESLPYITQISWVLIDAQQHNIIESYNEYIRLPVGVVVPEIVTQITGITAETCARRGVNVVDAMAAFAQAFFRSSTVVAHNFAFDRTMICAEVERHRSELYRRVPYISCMFHPDSDSTLGVHQYDTMFRTMKICQIYREKKNGGAISLKPPKLVELYRTLFHETPSNLHNSMVDVLVCARCFLKVRYQWDVSDAQFREWMAAAAKSNNKNYRNDIAAEDVGPEPISIHRKYVPAEIEAATPQCPTHALHSGVPLPPIHAVSAGYAT